VGNAGNKLAYQVIRSRRREGCKGLVIRRALEKSLGPHKKFEGGRGPRKLRASREKLPVEACSGETLKGKGRQH